MIVNRTIKYLLLQQTGKNWGSARGKIFGPSALPREARLGVGVSH